MSEYTGRRRGRPEPQSENAPHAPFDPYDAPSDAPYDAPYEYPEAAYGYFQDEQSADADYAEPDYAAPGYTAYEDDDPIPDYREDVTYQAVDYAAPRIPISRGRTGAPDPDRDPDRGIDPDPDRGIGRDGDRPEPTRRGARSTTTIPSNPVVPIAALTIVLAVSAFISPTAVAVVTAAIQAATVVACLALAGHPGRRAAAVAVLPALAANAGTFAFQADESATAVAAALGCGFVLAGGDAVVRAARRGVERGASRDLATVVATMLLAGLAALLTATARLDPHLVVGAAVLGGVAAFAATKRLGAPWSAALGPAFTAAALVSYAAAILMS